MELSYPPSSCVLCLSPLNRTSLLKDTEGVLNVLGSVFNISRFFVDSLKCSSNTPLHCEECTRSLNKLHIAQSQEEGLRETVLELQKQLCLRLKELAKVVGTIESERSRVHGDILKSERQLQGAGKYGMMTEEGHSLRQLIMGALLLKSETNCPDPGISSAGVHEFPNNFVVTQRFKEQIKDRERHPLVKVEDEDEWDYVVLNESAAVEPPEFAEEFEITPASGKACPLSKKRKKKKSLKASKKSSTAKEGSTSSLSKPTDGETTLSKKEVQRLMSQEGSRVSYVTRDAASEVWKTFQVIHVDDEEIGYVRCKGCLYIYAWSCRNGTTTLRRHVCSDGTKRPTTTSRKKAKKSEDVEDSEPLDLGDF